VTGSHFVATAEAFGTELSIQQTMRTRLTPPGLSGRFNIGLLIMPSQKATLTSIEALENAFGSNPLLAPLPPFIEVSAMPNVLSNRPLDLVSWQNVPVVQRTDFLGMMVSHFVPTPEAIEIAFALQQMIRTGYVERHPGLPCNRQQRRAIAQLPNDGLQTSAWFPRSARGMVIKGITGLGKSFITSRALSIYPQVHRHSTYEPGGWIEQIQLVYLTVSMSADNSRQGFLDNILLAVDIAIGKENAPDSFYKMYGGKNSRLTIEQLMVVTGKILSALYLGLLVIEEIQPRNFSSDQELVFLFFLRLLNFGIPVLLIGNPGAFLNLESYAQDCRRMYKGKCFELWPADSGFELAWQTYVKGKMQCTLLPIGFEIGDSIFKKIYEYTGGIHDFFDTLWTATQERALRKNRKSITLDDIEYAYEGRQMRQNHILIKALVDRNANELSRFKDVPIGRFMERWGIPSAESVRSGTAQNERTSQPKGAGRRDGSNRQSGKSAQTAPKSRASRARQAEAAFRKRQERAARAQRDAIEASSPDPMAARKRSNAEARATDLAQLRRETSNR
jgi:hypothetical protein